MFVNLVYNKYLVFNFLGIQITMHMRNKFQQFLKSVSVGNNNSKLMWSPAFIIRVSIWKTKTLCFTNEQSHFHQIECYHHNNMDDKLLLNFGAKFQHLWLICNFTLKIMLPWQLFSTVPIQNTKTEKSMSQERSLSPMIFVLNQMVYSQNYSLISLFIIWLSIQDLHPHHHHLINFHQNI